MKKHELEQLVAELRNDMCDVSNHLRNHLEAHSKVPVVTPTQLYDFWDIMTSGRHTVGVVPELRRLTFEEEHKKIFGDGRNEDEEKTA